jgi:hypothetical protein
VFAGVCVGNYSIPIFSGNVEGANMLAGAGIMNFPNVYVQQTRVNSHYSVDNPRFWLNINHSCPNCQFAGLTYTGQCYWSCVLSHPERDQLQNCIDIEVAELEKWLKAN